MMAGKCHPRLLMKRWDETWHRLREWTNGQAPAERLAAQVLLAEGFSRVDPSHPLGGPDGGKDAIVERNGERWVMAVYFPRGERPFREIKAKFLADDAGVAANSASGIAFVTNQELRLEERKRLEEAVDSRVELFHLERITTILDQPRLHGVRAQFLHIPVEGSTVSGELPTAAAILDAATGPAGAPDHRDIYEGMLLLTVVAMPAPAGLRHPGASDPKPALDAAAERARELTARWPVPSLLAKRLGEGWQSDTPHLWLAGRTFAELHRLSRYPSAAASFVTRDSVLCVERTWPTRICDDAGRFAFYAAREPEVAAETVVSLALTAGLLESVPGLAAVDIAVLIAAGTPDGWLVSSERVVDGGRFGEVVALRDPPAEIPARHLDRGRLEIHDLAEPFLAATELIGPWFAGVRNDDLFSRLRDE
jgi:hypothetical protein